MSPGPLVLVVLDGWGVAGDAPGNAITRAKTPHWDSYLEKYPHTLLSAGGEDVGLPEGQMGNSEVGHLNLGAGRVVYQDLTRITRAIANGSFFANPELVEAFERARQRNAAVHLMGLLSDGGVHSHINHLFALLEMARRFGQERVCVHAFLDGRDVPPANAGEYLAALEERMRSAGRGEVASIMGRYWAMDRDRRWERTARAYFALTKGEGLQAARPIEALEAAYARGETDEFVQPAVIVRDGRPSATVSDGDSVIFFNFRPDRARQITRAFVDRDFQGFDRGPSPPRVHFVCFTQYDRTIEAPVAFKPERIVNTLGEVLSRHGIRQLRLAETEKYAHVTFFFNGGVEAPNPGEERILIPSPKVATYDLKPEMSAFEVTEAFLENLGRFEVVIMNYANPDMVGHTGRLEAAVKAVQAVDACLGRVVPAVLARRGTVLLTGDHGNADHVLDEEGRPFTAHTSNPVPFVLIAPETEKTSLRPGRLEDVAPTMLDLLGIPRPEEMTGRSLIVKEA
ncbi:MAG: 2,3-bisphosphoglycerate-independent phosphoglycerate mutase [Bacillota bacterium]|nr:2,3-bisphosphoglycerate-independent phosphoglycerate mutase [Bacillota bacterium]